MSNGLKKLIIHPPKMESVMLVIQRRGLHTAEEIAKHMNLPMDVVETALQEAFDRGFLIKSIDQE